MTIVDPNNLILRVSTVDEMAEEIMFVIKNEFVTGITGRTVNPSYLPLFGDLWKELREPFQRYL